MDKKRNKSWKRLVCSFIVLSLISGTGVTAHFKFVQANPVSKTNVKEYDSNEIVVVYDEEVKEDNKLPDCVSQEIIAKDSLLVQTENKKELKEAIQTLRKDSDVAYIQPNYRYHIVSSVTNDTYSNKQWFYNDLDYNIGITKAWDMGIGINKKVIVAITDTGIDYNHVDLQGKIWTNKHEIADNKKDDDKNGFADDIHGWNFALGNNKICNYKMKNGSYVDNHGTHVAGIINATKDNRLGIAGIASKSNVWLMPIKIFDEEGATTTVALIKGIRYAEKNGATICNMSLSGDKSNTSKDQLLYNTMKQSKMLFVCAAGNGTESTNGLGFDITVRQQVPASFELENKICVGNLNQAGRIDESSCYSNTQVDIAAPGTDIISTGVDGRHSKQGTYISMSGTSMATPMVTGVAAMLCSYYGTLKPSQIKEAILNGAKINQNLSGKVVENKMLSASGAMRYYQEHPFIRTVINRMKDSNKKKVLATVTDYNGKVDSIYYTFGEREADYFQKGTVGTRVKLVNGKGSFTVSKSGIYTVYVKDSNGMEAIGKIENERL